MTRILIRWMKSTTMRTIVPKLLMRLSLVKRTLTMETRRLVKIAEILEMRMMILCPCQLVQEKSMVWIYEAFPHLGNYAKKSLNSSLPISRLLRWHTAKSDNIVEGDPFKYKGRSTKVVHPYIIPTIRETKQNYTTTLKPYTDEVKDTIIDALKASLKGVIVLTYAVGNVDDEYSNDHNPNQPCENSVPSTSKDESLCERVLEQSKLEIVAFVREEKLRRDEKKKKKKVDDDNFSSPTVDDNIHPLAVVDDDLVAVDAYFAEEVDEEMKEEEMKEKEKQQDEEKMIEKEEEKMEENDEEKEEEKLEEKKEEESEEENLKEKKNEENEASEEEEKKQQEEKITEKGEEEKLEEGGLAIGVAEVEKEIDMMGIVMELNGEVGDKE